jgi:hypothetical protein
MSERHRDDVNMEGNAHANGGDPRRRASGHTSIELFKHLDQTMSELKKGSDLEGLLRLEALALAISDRSTGSTRKKALRLANKTSGAVNQLRQLGIETAVEQADRTKREARENELRAEVAATTLLERLDALLHLLLFEGSALSADLASLEMLATRDRDGFLQIGIPASLTSRGDVLVGGFEQSYALFVAAAARETNPMLWRELKSLAVELVSRGAEVRDLTEDPVPLVAYALFDGQLSFDVESHDVVADRLDDIVLSFAGESAELPPGERAAFVTLFRLALLLGEAQACAERDL